MKSKGFVLIHFVLIMPVFLGIAGAAGAGSLLISRYRHSLGLCRTGLLETVIPLQTGARNLMALNPRASAYATEELALRARLVACAPVPITCVEPAGKLSRLMVKMAQLNQKRNLIRAKAEALAEQRRNRLLREIIENGHTLIRTEPAIALSFDKTPPLATTPAWLTGPRFESRNTLRQTYRFHPLKHVPAWLRGLLGKNLKWNSIPLACAVTLKNQTPLPPISGLTVAKL